MGIKTQEKKSESEHKFILEIMLSNTLLTRSRKSAKICSKSIDYILGMYESPFIVNHHVYHCTHSHNRCDVTRNIQLKADSL